MQPAKRSLAFEFALNFVICGLLSVLVSGCISGKTFWQKNISNRAAKFTISGEFHKEGRKPPLVLGEEQITNSVVGTETNGALRVSYGKDLQPEAALMAGTLAPVLAETERIIAAPLPARLHVYLLRMPGEDRVIGFNMSLLLKERIMPWVIVLTNAPAGKESVSSSAPDELWAGLEEFPAQLFVMAHELSEMHLIDPQALLVMPDINASKGFIHIHLKYHTRWFRDGFANYAAYKTSEYFRHQLAQAGSKPAGLRFVETSMQPFLKLARVKNKVFDWNQNSKKELDDEDYDAAMALFLLIEQRKGPEAISDILRELPKIKLPDGKNLLKVVRQKTGLDLNKLAREFEFPDLGLEMRADSQGRLKIENVASDSWGARANLLKGDELIEANGSPIGSLLDYELQVLKALGQDQKLALKVSRSGQSYTTGPFSLPGQQSPAQRAEAAARR